MAWVACILYKIGAGLMSVTLLKRDSATSVLWVNFAKFLRKHFLYRLPPVGASNKNLARVKQ